MSDLLQHRHKIGFLIILLFFIFAKGVHAGSLGVSPPSLEFNFASSGERCEELNVYVDIGFVLIEDYWSLDGARDVTKYNLNAEDVGLKINYEEGIYVNKEGQINVCLGVENEGRYNGVLLLFYGNAVIGIWVKVNYGSNIDLDKPLIVGNVVKEVFKQDIEDYSLIWPLFFTTFLLILLLALLVVYYSRMKRSEIV